MKTNRRLRIVCIEMHRKAHQKQPSPPYPSVVLCISLVLCFQPLAARLHHRRPPPCRLHRLLFLLLRRRLMSLPPPPPLSAAPHPRVAGSARGTSPAGAAEQGDRRDLTGGSREAGAVAGGAAEEDVREWPSASGCGRLRPPRGPTTPLGQATGLDSRLVARNRA